MTPADVVLAELGVRGLARQLGIDPSTVIRWRQGKGNIPSRYHRQIIELADGKVSTKELVFGR